MITLATTALTSAAAHGDSSTHATLWVVLVALVSLAGTLASIWRSFVTPKEYATLRYVKELETRLDKRWDERRGEYKELLTKIDVLSGHIADLRVEMAKKG